MRKQIALIIPMFPLHQNKTELSAFDGLKMSMVDRLISNIKKTGSYDFSVSFLFLEEQGDIQKDLLNDYEMYKILKIKQRKCQNVPLPPVNGYISDICVSLKEMGHKKDTLIVITSPYCFFSNEKEFDDILKTAQSGVEILPLVTCQHVELHPVLLREGVFDNERKFYQKYPINFKNFWIYDDKYFCTVSAKDGKQLYRRQDYPDVYELNYGLIVGELNQIINLQTILEKESDHIYFCKNTIMLCNSIDLIHAEVLREQSLESI